MSSLEKHPKQLSSTPTSPSVSLEFSKTCDLLIHIYANTKHRCAMKRSSHTKKPQSILVECKVQTRAMLSKNKLPSDSTKHWLCFKLHLWCRPLLYSWSDVRNIFIRAHEKGQIRTNHFFCVMNNACIQAGMSLIPYFFLYKASSRKRSTFFKKHNFGGIPAWSRLRLFRVPLQRETRGRSIRSDHRPTDAYWYTFVSNYECHTSKGLARNRNP